jgi:ribonuclease J
MSLKFIALSGTVAVTENLYVYEANDQMMVLDCGVGFPDIDMQGVDLVIPDFSYIIKNKEKLAGILISQGHEDHMGALPYLLREVKVKIHSTALVAEFIKDKMKDSGVGASDIHVFDPENDSFEIGPFKINPFRVTHSVPDTVGFAIDTPEGRIFHVPEHKMDQNPVDGMPFDISRAKSLANEKVLFLASDCLGSNKEGRTPGEQQIEGNLLNIVNGANQTVFFTAISSNIGRFQQALNVAKKVGRKVVFVGRSVQKKCEIAHNLGLLHYRNDDVIPLKRTARYPNNKLIYIIAGCYGQVDSSVYRLALGEHNRVQAESGDTFIFSADPAPPYTKESEDFVIDHLIDQGLDVHYYDIDEGLYVSGHGSQDDITDLFTIAKPKYFIPIGGTIRFMHAYEKLATKFGAPKENVFKLKPGEGIEFSGGVAKRLARIPVKEVLVDGLGIGDVGRIILEDRKTLGHHGVAIVLVKIDSKKGVAVEDPEIISRGFVFERDEKKFLNDTAKALRVWLDKHKKLDWKTARQITTEFLTDVFFDKTARKPMIIPVVVEV